MNFFELGYDKFFFKFKKKNNFKKNKYWEGSSTFIDPDGKKRNLLKERKKKLNDLKNEISFIKKNVKKTKKRIIDLGCGFGFFLSDFNEKWEKVGIELSNYAVEKVQKDIKIYQYDLNKILEKEKLKKLSKFDVVFSYHVIEHLNNPINFVKNSYSLLKDNGIFVLGTPNFDSGVSRKFKKKYRFFHDKTHISFFSENSLFRLLTICGYEIIKVDYPFFETEHFNKKNLLKLLNLKEKISPPFYGNLMTFYCRKKSKKNLKRELNFYKKNYSNLVKSLR